MSKYKVKEEGHHRIGNNFKSFVAFYTIEPKCPYYIRTDANNKSWLVIPDLITYEILETLND